MKRLVFVLFALGAAALAAPADARHHHAAAHGGHASSHGSSHHGSSRHGGGRHRAGGHRSAAAPAPVGPAMSQDEAAQLALRDAPGEVTTATKTMRGSETFYSFDIRGPQGTRRVLVDATHGKVMATIPVGE